MEKLKLRCYVCGKPLSGQVALVSMSRTEVDRAFVVHPEACLEQVEEDNTTLVLYESTKRQT